LADAERAAAAGIAREAGRPGPDTESVRDAGTTPKDLAAGPPEGAAASPPARPAGGPLGVGAATTAARAAPAAGRLEAAAAVLAHSIALIDAAGPACVAVKPQLAFFEQLGFAGWLALEAVCAHARARELLVLADGKRGDVPSTALAYSRALTGATPTPFGAAAGLRADAFTANPLLGRDALEPLVAGARRAGAGAFLLVRTSNPGAADLLDPRARGRRAAVGAPRAPGRRVRRERLLRPLRRRRGHRRDRPRAPRAHARTDAHGAVPAARRGRPGRRLSPGSRPPSRPAAPPVW
jgi:orotidine 5'-phosphate decarboxylase subfamily 2